MERGPTIDNFLETAAGIIRVWSTVIPGSSEHERLALRLGSVVRRQTKKYQATNDQQSE